MQAEMIHSKGTTWEISFLPSIQTPIMFRSTSTFKRRGGEYPKSILMYKIRRGKEGDLQAITHMEKNTIFMSLAQQLKAYSQAQSVS